MFVFLVIAVTATVTNGASDCPNITDNGEVNCNQQGLTAFPNLPEGAIKV